MKKTIYIVKRKEFDPWTSNGLSEIGDEKELKRSIGELEDGDLIYEATLYGTIKVGLWTALPEPSKHKSQVKKKRA